MTSQVDLKKLGLPKVTPLRENEQKAFFMWLCLTKQCREWGLALPPFQKGIVDSWKRFENLTKWTLVKEPLSKMDDAFTEYLGQDLSDKFWTHSEHFSNILETIYKKCPNDSQVLDALNSVDTILQGDSMIVSLSEGEAIKEFYELWNNATDKGKNQVLVNLRKNQK
jgi:hypothetical protein